LACPIQTVIWRRSPSCVRATSGQIVDSAAPLASVMNFRRCGQGTG
jgi:hypothetical protein